MIRHMPLGFQAEDNKSIPQGYNIRHTNVRRFYRGQANTIQNKDVEKYADDKRILAHCKYPPLDSDHLHFHSNRYSNHIRTG